MNPIWAKVREVRKRDAEQASRLKDEVPPEAYEFIVTYGVPMPPAHFVRIESESDSTGYFLYHCDEFGEHFADDWFLTLDKAKAQAESEYGIPADVWREDAPFHADPRA